jgi:hypothetical protein
MCSYPPRHLKGRHLKQCADRARTRTVGGGATKSAYKWLILVERDGLVSPLLNPANVGRSHCLYVQPATAHGVLPRSRRTARTGKGRSGAAWASASWTRFKSDPGGWPRHEAAWRHTHEAPQRHDVRGRWSCAGAGLCWKPSAAARCHLAAHTKSEKCLKDAASVRTAGTSRTSISQ